MFQQEINDTVMLYSFRTRRRCSSTWSTVQNPPSPNQRLVFHQQFFFPSPSTSDVMALIPRTHARTRPKPTNTSLSWSHRKHFELWFWRFLLILLQTESAFVSTGRGWRRSQRHLIWDSGENTWVLVKRRWALGS